MRLLNPNQAFVADDVVLDGRLALFHQRENWLAVADLHFGYEVSQRAAGRLMPMWGMISVRDRLRALLRDYRPRHLVIVGDLVHDRAAAPQAGELLRELAGRCELIVLAGNHDRHLVDSLALRESWETPSFHFHHGHCAIERTERIQIIGHHHPAGSLTDGAGLRLKCPAFVQQSSCWILPAFSPWSSGTNWTPDSQSRVWLCTPKRILRLREAEPAAT